MLPLRRLLRRELLLLIGLFAGLSAMLVWVGMGRSLEQQVQARSKESLGRLASELSGDLATVERVGRTVAHWWGDGRLSFRDIPAAEPQIAPMLEEFTLVANLVFVSVDGWGLSMSRLGDGLSSYHLDARKDQGLKRYFRKKGTPLSDAVWEPTPFKVFQRPWWKVAAESPSPRWVGAYRFVNIPTHGISYMVPLRDKQGKLQGAVCVDIFLRSLSERVWAAQPTPHAQVLVSDADGLALILPNGLLAEAPTTTELPFLRRLGPDFLPLFQQLLGAWEVQPKKEEPFRLRFGGEAYTCINQPLSVTQGVDWRLSLAIPDRDFQGPVRRLSLLLLAAGLGIMGLAAWRVVHLARRFSIPLEQLASQAQSLEKGEVSRPVETQIQEIRTLGQALQKAGGAIQEEANLQRQLLQSQRIQIVGTLSGGIAHDVNNQLAAIVGQLDLVRQDLPEGHPALRRMTQAEEAAHRCSTMVRRLLKFTHQTRHEFQTFDLNDLVRRTGTLLVRVLGGRVHLDLGLDPGPMVIHGDPVGLEQVIMNLAINARDAMPEGGVIFIGTAHSLDGSVRLTVKDTGLGIPEAILPHIFEPFFSTKEAEKGSGLGLAMVNGIVNAHGGRIEVQSQPGQGTEVRIFLGTGASLKDVSAAVPPLAEHRVSLKGRKVLVVDDEVILRDLLAELLHLHGAEVTVASDGVVGWQRLQEGPFDLLISDQRMPRLTGLELLALLRERDAHLPVILISGYGLEGSEEDRTRDPRLRMLAKPFGFDRLLTLIDELL
jgi:signal transduction histidine kinase/CheY-like chemotaxis protein